ncbi:hypothetical protein JW859_08155 [bacterium]|nr:hypothetical protein [bacterium]
MYPYLTLSLILVALAIIALAFSNSHRPLVALGGVLMIPFGLFSFEFIPEYWDPQLIAWWGITSPEDLLFSTSTGVLACFIAYLPLGKRLVFDLHWRVILSRFFFYSVLGIGTGYFLDWIIPRLDTMTGTLASVVLIGAILLIIRRELWPAVAWGGLGFSVMYALIVLLGAWLFPAFLADWTPTRLINLEYHGLPASELFWAAGNGAVWPLLVAHASGCRLAKQPARAPAIMSAGQGDGQPAASSERA